VAKGAGTGLATLGIGVALDYLVNAGLNAVDEAINKKIIKDFAEQSPEKQKAIIERYKKRRQDLKDWIENPLFYLEKGAVLGQETSSEKSYDRVDALLKAFEAGIDAQQEGESTIKAPVQARQTGGGIFDVPGHGQGDQVPMMLPPGAFVLNRVASQEMFARGGEPSGLVPTLLEPGEKVFMPGDPLMGMAMAFNDTFSRFQTGGMVDDGASRGRSQPSPTGKAKEGSGQGVQAILSAAEANIGLSKGTGEQCANTTRSVLKSAGHPAGTKVTQTGDLDPEGTKYNGPGFAASFAGSDMGTVNKNFNSVKAGEIMLWKDTYKKYADQPAGAITHVGIAGEGNVQYDHSKSRGWEKVPRESRNFAASIDLNGEASGGSNNNSGGSGSSGGSSGGIFGGLMSSATSMMSKMMGPVSKKIQNEMSSIMNEAGLGNIMGDINQALKSEMSALSSSMPSMSSITRSSSTNMNEQMRKIKEAMNPEEDRGTIVQVIPGPEQQKPTVEGTTANNRPFDLSVRCPSWAAADYRYDRSLNTSTS
jgi:hypothetical protein